jgi:hypothetical protein
VNCVKLLTDFVIFNIPVRQAAQLAQLLDFNEIFEYFGAMLFGKSPRYPVESPDISKLKPLCRSLVPVAQAQS